MVRHVHVAAHCITLQCTTTGTRSCLGVYHVHTATHCNTLQHTATHCNTLQQSQEVVLKYAMYTLQHAATRCNTLQHPATPCNRYKKSSWSTPCTHCNTLQHTATHCNTLQQVQEVVLEYAMYPDVVVSPFSHLIFSQQDSAVRSQLEMVCFPLPSP